jgi:hypothetical protein
VRRKERKNERRKSIGRMEEKRDGIERKAGEGKTEVVKG